MKTLRTLPQCAVGVGKNAPLIDLRKYRERPAEQERITDLLTLIPPGRSVLDVGARDGYLSRLLTSSFDLVTALDLKRPQIPDDGVTTVAGNVTCLQFPDNHFDTVLCAEVLEHIPPSALKKACDEITRVTRDYVVIGVPYNQDTRVGRTTCYSCGKPNPPWGHVNVFDEDRLKELFPRLTLERLSFVGTDDSRTNYLSALLMDLAGNPFGTYYQEECCLFCGANLKPPPKRRFVQKALARAGHVLERLQSLFVSPHPNWVHSRFSKRDAASNEAARSRERAPHSPVA